MVYLHVTCGLLLLIIGTYIVLKNIDKIKNHSILGYIYCLLAVFVNASSVLLAIYSGHTFLIPLSILITYQLICGLLLVTYKNQYFKSASYLAIPMLPIAVSLMFYEELALFAISLIYLLIILYQILLSRNLGYLCKMEYLSQHISMMLGSLIAMVTALVLRINSEEPLNPLYWLVPTLIAVIAIRWYKIKYAPINTKRKLKWY